MKKTLQALLALALALGLVMGLASAAEAKNATRITMSRKALTMDWGTAFTLSVVTTPANASDRKLIAWEKGEDPNDLIESIEPVAADPRKAKVVVRSALPEYPMDSVVITASTPDGKKAACRISVRKVNVSRIDVTPAAKTVYFTASAPTWQMAAPKFTPAVAGDQTSYEWSSNNPAVAEVDPGSGLVTFKKEGRAKIIATYTTSAGRKLAGSCAFTVKPIRVKSVSIKKGGESADVVYVDKGETFTLSAALTSAIGGRRPSYDAVAWESDDPSVVKVASSDGDSCDFTGSKSGSATITATTDTGKFKKTARCTVYVRDSNPAKVTITAGGDCVLGGDPRTTGITARSTQANYESLVKNNSDYPFARIKRLFDQTGPTGHENLSIVNVEVCLTTKGGSNPKTNRRYVFRGKPANAQALSVAEIDIANIANNHTADFGSDSFINTAKNIGVGETSSVRASGYCSYNGANYVPVKTVGGKRIGFYGVQHNQMPLSKLQSRIKKVKGDNRLDMLVFTVHWTGQKENVRGVNSAMRTYARKAIDYGADLVIGHHRHEVSGIEKYKGKYILYDLGNLVTGGASSPYTYVVQVDFDISASFAETAKRGGEDQIRIYPLYTTSEAAFTWNKKAGKYSTRVSNNWQPVPAEDAIRYINPDPVEGGPVSEDVRAQVIQIINGNSPSGVYGKFQADAYIRSVPK